MLGTDQVVATLPILCVPELAAFPLADRVPAENNISPLCKPLAESLVVSFSVRRMSAWHQHGRVFLWRIIRNVEKSCYVESRQALVDQFLNVEAAHLNASGDLRIQRRASLGKSANHLKKVLPQPGLHSLQIFFVSNLRPLQTSSIVEPPRHVGLILQIGSDSRANLGSVREHTEGLGGWDIGGPSGKTRESEDNENA